MRTVKIINYWALGFRVEMGYLPSERRNVAEFYKAFTEIYLGRWTITEEYNLFIKGSLY